MQRPGLQQLRHSFVQAHKRERTMRAIAKVCAEKTYHAVTVADIVAEAGIARNTFYENFSSKEDAFLGAFTWTVQMAEEACLEAEDTDEAVADIVALVEKEQCLARLVLIEGPLGALALYDDTTRRFAEFAELPEAMGEMVVGGIMRILAQHLREPREDLLEGLQEFVRRSFSTAAVAA